MTDEQMIACGGAVSALLSIIENSGAFLLSIERERLAASRAMLEPLTDAYTESLRRSPNVRRLLGLPTGA